MQSFCISKHSYKLHYNLLIHICHILPHIMIILIMEFSTPLGIERRCRPFWEDSIRLVERVWFAECIFALQNLILKMCFFFIFCRTELDIESKRWRVRADVLNDIAMGIEIFVLPMFLQHATFILCATTTMKAIVGVAGGATRAALTQHHAIRGNLADVASKDSAQETCVNLIASFVGLFMLTAIKSQRWEHIYIYNHSAIDLWIFHFWLQCSLYMLLHSDLPPYICQYTCCESGLFAPFQWVSLFDCLGRVPAQWPHDVRGRGEQCWTGYAWPNHIVADENLYGLVGASSHWSISFGQRNWMHHCQLWIDPREISDCRTRSLHGYLFTFGCPATRYFEIIFLCTDLSARSQSIERSLLGGA